MKRAKKRWAWKPAHQRPHFSHWWSRPPSSGSYHRLAQTQHQTQTRRALSRLQQGEEEDAVHFPYHHKHWLRRWWG
jgi:hypothetical protein